MNVREEHEAKKKAFKTAITLLVQAKVNNAPDFLDLVDAFAEEFANQVSLTGHFNSIEQNISLISNKILIIDKRIEREAKEFYSGISLEYDSLKRRLIDARENMSLHLKNANYKAACKYIVVQAEAMCNQLSQPENFDFINWKKKQNIISVTISADWKGNEYLSTSNLLRAADLKFKCQMNPDVIRDIKDIRDYESHGYPQSKIVQMDALLAKVTEKWEEYDTAWTGFLNKLIDAFYIYEQK